MNLLSGWHVRVLALAAVLAAPIGVHAQSWTNQMQAASEAEAAGRMREAFDGYMAAMKALPESATPSQELILRTRVVRVAVRLTSPPPLPADAVAHAQQGALAVKQSGTDGARAAEQEFHRAVLAAPWYAEALFNLAVAQDNLKKTPLALGNLKLYLLLKVQDTETVRAHVVALESALSEPDGIRQECAGQHDKGACAKLLAFLRDRCTEGFGPSCGSLGLLYYSSIGNNDDTRAGESWMEGCNAGDGESCSALAGKIADLQNYRGPKLPARDELYRRGADLLDQGCTVGNAFDCTQLALQYELGHGLATDPKRAAALFVRGCETEEDWNASRATPSYKACHLAGEFLLRSYGEESDLRKGIVILQRVCDAASNKPGDPVSAMVACVDLGRLFEEGTRVSQDLTRAAAFYKRACEAGNSWSCERVKSLKSKQK